MRICIVGPNSPIPPKGWGAVESLIWDMANTLNQMGHEVHIINDGNPLVIIDYINKVAPDFVHINYDDWIHIYPYIQYPRAITTHFAYIERIELMGDYKQRVFDHFETLQPNVFGLSNYINNVYNDVSNIPKNKLFLNPNGVNFDAFRKTYTPKFPERTLYLAKIDQRKRQYKFQSINSIYYVGDIADDRFDKTINYMGSWDKQKLYSSLTDYGNLALLSDGEAHPLVCLEAFSAGLGVVISEWAIANLDLDRNFITVILENEIDDLEFIEYQIAKNKEYSLNNREEILDYAKQFDWKNVLEKYYIPNIQKIIHG